MRKGCNSGKFVIFAGNIAEIYTFVSKSCSFVNRDIVPKIIVLG